MVRNDERLQTEAVQELRAAGLKATPQRVAIVASLAGDESHPTAQEIFDRLRPGFPGMAFATVYNTLSTLKRVGFLASLSYGGATRFDPNVEPHYHAVCDRCGEVRDVTRAAEHPGGDDLPEVEGFEVHRVERIYRGLCLTCRSERDGTT